MTALAPLPPVEIERLTLVWVDMPMVVPFRTSFGTQQELTKLLVRLDTPEATGWGECAAPTAPIYNHEYVDAAADVIEHHLAPPLQTTGRAEATTLADTWAHIKGHRMAKAAIEMAVLDAQLQAAGRSLADHLGVVDRRVPCGVSVGIPDGGLEELVEQVHGYLDDGYLRIKAKIEPGFDVEPVRALRSEFGNDLRLQVDANAGYPPEEHGVFRVLDDLGLTLIEQPYRPDLLTPHARLAREIVTPICLDESIDDAYSAAEAIAVGACQIVNIKPGRVGGIAEAVRIHDLCEEHGVPVWIGGMLETGLGRAVNVALAALPNVQLPGDTSASARYYATDLTEPFVLDDGHLDVPDTPGIGRTPLPDVLDDVTRRTRELTA
ncbi:MAG: o-succinylbenzoate synthase [Nitriliruptorales bacterium]|nr:o-succinylbenzoate synthase [Nitriliruptorales bacterium]